MSTRKIVGGAGDFIAYFRVSTQKQGESGLGLEAQRSAVERYVSSAKGRLIAEYSEVESGRKNDRPALQAAIAHSKRAPATLVIAKLDRLSRNVHFISGLMESAADFVACDMPYANRLTLHILAAMAEHEREMISQRTRAAMAAAKARGVRLGNPRLAEAREKSIQVRRKPPAAEDLKTIIASYRVQGLTLRAIAAKLNELGIKTPTGASWYASTVKRLG